MAYEELMGEPMRVEDHPANNYKVASDNVVPIGPAMRARNENESMDDMNDRLRKGMTRDTLNKALGINTVIPLVRPKE